ncbi:MAG: DUF924 family protein [Planctomycetota bacterium]
MSAAIAEILDFWFGRLDDAGFPLDARQQLWFGAAASDDRVIRERFLPLVVRALGGGLHDWYATERGRLAAILCCDQFPRSCWRGRARAFAGDALACRLARTACETGLDRAMAPIERTFCYMPFQHAESLTVQELGVDCFARLHAEAPASRRAETATQLAYARNHRALIAHFGRFPHRNRALGRRSTPAEQRYLAGEPERYGQ